MCAVLYDERRQTYCVVVLQNCIGFVEGETGACDEAGVEFDVDGSEEDSTKFEEALDIKEDVCIKFEDAIDIKDETPEAISFPTIKTEREVRLWGVCELVTAQAFRPFIAPKGNCEIPVIFFLLCVMFRLPYSFKIWIAILKGKDFLEVISINVRTVLKCIEEVVLEFVGCISLALNGDH